MNSLTQRNEILELVDEAVGNGARYNTVFVNIVAR